MTIDTTIIEKPTAYQNVLDQNKAYKVVRTQLKDVANLVGSGAGANVTTAVAVAGLPATYTVLVTPGQKAAAFVTSKTTSGFNVVLAPILATETIAAGTFDVEVMYEI